MDFPWQQKEENTKKSDAKDSLLQKVSSTEEQLDENVKFDSLPQIFPSGLMEIATRETTQYANQNKQFYHNLTLALTVAFYVTLFGLPVYSSSVSWYIFGERHRLDETSGEFRSMCPPNKLGLKVNDGTEEQPILVNYNRTHIADKRDPYAWCGFLPSSYLSHWPSVVQTVVYTVDKGTGSTIKLAWQCIAGTFVAVLNIYFLTILFPKGANDDHYQEWVAWVDLVLVLFLLLASNANTNTKIMGMVWTVCLMLHFMDRTTQSTLGSWGSFIPGVNWDGETTIVMLTSVVGCILAVLAALLPSTLGNLSRTRDDAKQVVNGLDDIMTNAIEYWSSEYEGPRRYQIFAKMSALSGTTDRVTKNLKDSFWETMDIGRYGRIRKLYTKFNNAIIGHADEVYLIKAALQSIQFETKANNHRKMVKSTIDALTYLKDKTIACLYVLERCCSDGVITPLECDKITLYIKEIEYGQLDLSQKYQLAQLEGMVPCSEEVAPDSLFIYSMSHWAEEVKSFGEEIRSCVVTKDQKEGLCTRFCEMCVKNIRELFSFEQMMSKDQLRFVAMNGIPILITYAISMYAGNRAIFTYHNATMPATLALLVMPDYGATFLKNVQRLMGVVFGRTLPLLVMSVITLFSCDNSFRVFFHAVTLFIFYFMFCYMYYSSEVWATVGICVAGFGCYPILHQCDPTQSIDYAIQYKDIAQVIIAIILKLLFAHIFTTSQPRDTALKNLNDLHVAIGDSFEAFFDGDIETSVGTRSSLVESKKKAANALAACKDIAPRCDPSLDVVSGLRTPFKYDLYNKAIEGYQLVLSDLDMLVLAMTGHKKMHQPIPEEEEGLIETKKVVPTDEENSNYDGCTNFHLHNIIVNNSHFGTVHQDFNSTLQISMELLEAVLAHDTENSFESQAAEKLSQTKDIHRLQGVSEFFVEYSNGSGKHNDTAKDIHRDSRIVIQLKRTQLALAVNALALATGHSSHIAKDCFQYMIY